MPIFVDRDKLSPRHIPERLPHREREIETALSFFRDLTEGAPCECTRVVQFVGPTGMGKTCSAYHVMRLLSQRMRGLGVELRPIYLNLKLEASSKSALYRCLAEKVLLSISSENLCPLFKII